MNNDQKQKPNGADDPRAAMNLVIRAVDKAEARKIGSRPEYFLVEVERKTLANELSSRFLSGLNLKQKNYYAVLREGGDAVTFTMEDIALAGHGGNEGRTLSVKPVLEVRGCKDGWQEHFATLMSKYDDSWEYFRMSVRRVISSKARLINERGGDPVDDFLANRRFWADYVAVTIGNELGLHVAVAFTNDDVSREQSTDIMNQILKCKLEDVPDQMGSAVVDYDFNFRVVSRDSKYIDAYLRLFSNLSKEEVKSKIEENVERHLRNRLSGLPKRVLVFQNPAEKAKLIAAVFPFDSIREENGVILERVTLDARFHDETMDIRRRQRVHTQNVINQKFLEWEKAMTMGDLDEAEKLNAEIQRLEKSIKDGISEVKIEPILHDDYQKLLLSNLRFTPTPQRIETHPESEIQDTGEESPVLDV
jgi:hypothetical protein